jgi:hypothetical protein
MSKSYKALFPSTFLKAADLGVTRPIGTIERIEEEPVGTGKDQTIKPICYFAEARLKPLVLNRINSETIEEIAGTDDIELWPGTRIQLYATKTEFGGKRVDCVRLQAPPARPVAKPAGKVTKARTVAAVEPDEGAAADDDDSPL